jgi:hypothetical protein
MPGFIPCSPAISATLPCHRLLWGKLHIHFGSIQGTNSKDMELTSERCYQFVSPGSSSLSQRDSSQSLDKLKVRIFFFPCKWSLITLQIMSFGRRKTMRLKIPLVLSESLGKSSQYTTWQGAGHWCPEIYLSKCSIRNSAMRSRVSGSPGRIHCYLCVPRPLPWVHSLLLVPNISLQIPLSEYFYTFWHYLHDCFSQ